MFAGVFAAALPPSLPTALTCTNSLRSGAMRRVVDPENGEPRGLLPSRAMCWTGSRHQGWATRQHGFRIGGPGGSMSGVVTSTVPSMGLRDYTRREWILTVVGIVLLFGSMIGGAIAEREGVPKVWFIVVALPLLGVAFGLMHWAGSGSEAPTTFLKTSHFVALGLALVVVLGLAVRGIGLLREHVGRPAALAGTVALLGFLWALAEWVRRRARR